MMVLSLISMTAMAAMAVYLYFSAHFASTRQMAAVPAMSFVMEVLAMGMLSGEFVWLTVILCVLRAAILLCCVGELRRDRTRARRRRRQRESFVRQMAYTEPVHENLTGKHTADNAVA